MKRGNIVLGFILLTILISVGSIIAPVNQTLTCTDNDGGENIYKASSAEGSNGRGFVDGCSFLNGPMGILKEAICKDGNATNIEITCPDEAPYCNRAVCSTEKPICTDTDNGNNPIKKGTITEPRNKDGPQHTDYCQNINTKQPWEDGTCKGELCGIREYYCTNPYVTTSYQDISCPNGCSNGACTEVPVDVTCTDTDGGLDYYNRGITDSASFSGIDAPTVWSDICLRDYGRYQQRSYIPAPDNGLTDEGGLLEGTCTQKIRDYGKIVTYECPNGCSNGACIKGEQITEQITCYFEDSEKEQQCYLAGSFTQEDEGTKFCKGIETCIIKVSGYKGEKITWKSSCGGWDYSTIDGIDNNIDFDCKGGEVEIDVLRDKGFRNTYWKCYDGYEEKQGSESSCKLSDVWQNYAKKACENRCYKDGSKCGINHFSISNECYLDSEEIVDETTDEGVEGSIDEPSLICKNSCAFDDKCYPFGYRKDGKYCSDETNFIEYKEAKESCDNNFECGSNICVDSECISSGFLKRVMDWFRKLFGGD